MTRQRFPLFSITVYFFASLMMLAVPANCEKKKITETLTQMMSKGMVSPNALQAKIQGRNTIVDVLGKKLQVTYKDKIKKIPNNIIY